MSVLEDLRSLIDGGLVGLLYRADQVARAEDRLSDNADRINALGYAEFFALIQDELKRSRILYLSRIYDPANPRFASYGIPGVLAFLDRHASELPVSQRQYLVAELVKRGDLSSDTTNLRDACVVRALVDSFRKQLPTGNPDDPHPLGVPLHSNRVLRDKVVVHPEAVDRSTLSGPTYEDHDLLLRLAKEFLALLTFSFFNTIDQTSDGRFPADSYAERAANCLARLLDDLEAKSPDAVG